MKIQVPVLLRPNCPDWFVALGRHLLRTRRWPTPAENVEHLFSVMHRASPIGRAARELERELEATRDRVAEVLSFMNGPEGPHPTAFVYRFANAFLDGTGRDLFSGTGGLSDDAFTPDLFFWLSEELHDRCLATVRTGHVVHRRKELVRDLRLIESSGRPTGYVFCDDCGKRLGRTDSPLLNRSSQPFCHNLSPGPITRWHLVCVMPRLLRDRALV